jgi:hypothetical protein
LLASEASERLRQGTASWWSTALRLSPATWGSYVTVGHVRGLRVDVTAMRTGFHHSWRALLKGDVVASETGCRFVGSIGMSSFVNGFMLFWLCGVTLFVGTGLVIAAGSVLSGRGGDVVFGLALAAGAGAMAAFGLLLNAAGCRWGAQDAKYLIGWLATTLDSETAAPLD